MTTAKKSTALKAAFKNRKEAAPIVAINNGRSRTQASGMVLIGANFPKHVRRTLAMIELDTERNMKALLGEAINDLAVKYGKPQPYTEGED